MAANDTGRDLVPPELAPPARPSWEAATRPAPAPRPSSAPDSVPPRPPASPPPRFTPPAMPAPSMSQDGPAGFDLAGNSLPGTSPSPTAYAPPTASWPPAPLGQAGGPSGMAADGVYSTRIPPDKMLMGIVLGLAIGLVGGIIIEKILLYAHFGLSLLYVGMGYGIGWGIHRVTGRGGAGLALLAVGLMVACLGVSHLVWAQDVLNEVRAAGNAAPGTTFIDALPVAMASLGIMHWVCITFGLLACYRGVESQEG